MKKAQFLATVVVTAAVTIGGVKATEIATAKPAPAPVVHVSPTPTPTPVATPTVTPTPVSKTVTPTATPNVPAGNKVINGAGGR